MTHGNKSSPIEGSFCYFCAIQSRQQIGAMGNFNTILVHSGYLSRTVEVDIYGLLGIPSSVPVKLLLMNDGQDLQKMNFASIVEKSIPPSFHLVCIGIHAGPDRKLEYGISGFPDFMQRGNRATAYTAFVMEELLPAIQVQLEGRAHSHIFLSGFSLGGLMAFDMAIDFPAVFSAVGVFSGSFWWRSKALDNGYDEARDRIMHAKLKTSRYHENRRFFLQVGALDETVDRNNNGIIDAIDDTLDIIRELELLGYEKGTQIRYLELHDGRHDVETWGRAMPEFMGWLASLA